MYSIFGDSEMDIATKMDEAREQKKILIDYLSATCRKYTKKQIEHMTLKQLKNLMEREKVK